MHITHHMIPFKLLLPIRVCVVHSLCVCRCSSSGDCSGKAERTGESWCYKNPHLTQIATNLHSACCCSSHFIILFMMQLHNVILFCLEMWQICFSDDEQRKVSKIHTTLQERVIIKAWYCLKIVLIVPIKWLNCKGLVQHFLTCLVSQMRGLI